MGFFRSGTAPPVLVLAVCAVSARFSKHPALRHDPPFLAGEAFASEARRQILKKFDTPNITNVTVCVLLALHEFGTCQGGRSWAMGGMATRMAHAIQLHKEANNDPLGKPHSRPAGDYFHQGEGGYMSFIDKEIRRRSMWSCFIMDRFTSSGTERPHLIAESEVEIQLPVHDRNLELGIPAVTEQLDGTVKDSGEEVGDVTGNMGVAAYMVRAVALYGRVVKYLNQVSVPKALVPIPPLLSFFPFFHYIFHVFYGNSNPLRLRKYKINYKCGVFLLTSLRGAKTATPVKFGSQIPNLRSLIRR